MRTLLSLAVGAGIAVMAPAAALAQCDGNLYEGHFDGHNAHASAPGTFSVGEAFTAYQTLNTTQVNPWYAWNQGSFEYTLVITGTVSAYADIPLFPGTFLRQVSFGGTSFAIYEDAGTTADYANTATFTDGVAILTGTITGMYGEGLVDGFNPDVLGVTGTATITGGSAAGSVLCSELLMNDFLAWLPPTSPAGFKEAYDSKWECCEVVSVEPSTWGGVKSLYR